MRASNQKPPLAAVGMISAMALAYEILLTRLFAIIHWSDLVAIAISLALLGYGASGTFLAILGRRLQTRFAPVFIGNAVLFGLSSLFCVHLAQQFPLDPLALATDRRQYLFLGGAFLTLALPFFAAANCIGLSLWHFRQDIPRLYGVDLIGAGMGTLLLLGGLALLDPADVLFAIFLGAMLVAVLAAQSLRWRRRPVMVLVLLTSTAVWLWGRPALQPAPYKDLSRSQAVLGAEVVYRESGIAGMLSVVQNRTVPTRTAPGLSLLAESLPPAQLAVFVDGDAAGTLDAATPTEADAGYLAYLTSALPYVLLEHPVVAVLNAGTGTGIEQALSLGADSVVAIERNPQLRQLVCGKSLPSNHRRCDPRVTWQTATPRAFAAGDNRILDLVTLDIVNEPTGLDAMKINFDVTREALQAYLRTLSAGGMLAIDGPSRLPPRLFVRIINTAHDALREIGIRQPGMHIAAIRGWQRFHVLVSRTALGAEATKKLREFAGSRGFDLVWLPDIRSDEVNRHQRLFRPLFHEHANRILGRDDDASAADTGFELAAASDDAPFPHRFTHWTAWWSAIPAGQGGLSRIDTGLLIGTTTLIVVGLCGIALIVLPLYWLGRRHTGERPPAGLRMRTLLYFSLLGVAFLFIEIAWIQRLQLFLGLPLFATAVVLIGFLVFAGMGSLWSQRLSAARARQALLGAIITILLASLAYLAVLPMLMDRLAALPLAVRGILMLCALAPLAFAMGMPFPLGLRGLGEAADRLIPWAWGINGVASVISAVAAPLLAMEIGFSGLIMIAVLAYLLLPAIQPKGLATS